MSVETWRTVSEFPDYEVSDLGRIRSHKFTAPRILSTALNRDGYVKVRLFENNRPFYRYVHSLVAAAFVGPRPDGLEVRHLDDNKLDNRAANLTYGTRLENMQDAVRNRKIYWLTKTHCPQGHPYDEANTMIRRNGWRTCRRCQSIRQNAARRRARERSVA